MSVNTFVQWVSIIMLCVLMGLCVTLITLGLSGTFRASADGATSVIVT